MGLSGGETVPVVPGDEGYPLLEHETLEPEGVFSSFLSKDYLDYPVGTVAVRRRTSFGELVFIDTQFVVRESTMQS